MVAWLVGTLVAPSVQGHGLTLPQEFWTYQILESFFEPLVAGDQKASLVSLLPLSGTERGLLPGILLYFSV